MSIVANSRAFPCEAPFYVEVFTGELVDSYLWNCAPFLMRENDAPMPIGQGIAVWDDDVIFYTVELIW